MNTSVTDKYGNVLPLPGPFHTVAEYPNGSVDTDIASVNRRNGQFYFSPDTMRFFRCRVNSNIYAGRIFVTSEANPSWDIPRTYTVRVAADDGSVATVGGFGDYQSRSGAHKAARRIAGV